MRITADEIRLLTFVIVALLVGATVRHWRQIQRASLHSQIENGAPTTPVQVGRNAHRTK